MGKDRSGERAEVGTGLSEPAPRRLLYGRRQGRPLNTGAREALASVLPRLALPMEALGRPLALFPGATSLALEVGFGGGEHLIAQARANPATAFIGAEPFINGVAKLSKAAADLPNVRIHHGDARDLLDALPDASLDRVFVLFPDPWPKTRHAKRRFVSEPNLVQIARVLKPGGVLRVASDIPDYIAWSLAEIARLNRRHGRRLAFAASRAADWRTRPADWPPTRYEAKALEAGRNPAYLAFLRAP